VIRVQAGMSTTRFCTLIDMPEQTWRRWQAKARAGGQPKGPWPQPARSSALALARRHALAHPAWGHRKVWARLRICGVRTSRRRVLRLMREHGLLSPRRVRQGKGISHDGRITTDAPDLVWGTDGTRVLTAEEGICWIFTAVDHYSCEVVGRHVCKRGDRFAALQPVSQGLLKHFGGVTADVGTTSSTRTSTFWPLCTCSGVLPSA